MSKESTIIDYKGCKINWNEQEQAYLVSHRTHTISLCTVQTIDEAKIFIDDYMAHHKLEDGIGGGEFQLSDDLE